MTSDFNTIHHRRLIGIATYNEIENLPRLVEQLLELVDDADILVVDDNSPDGTGRWCDEFGKQEPRLHVLHRAGKLGLGSATVCAMEYAIEHGYEILLTMDADFSHPPESAPQLLGELASHAEIDVTIGSRYVPGGQISGWPWTRRLMSRWVNRYARVLLRLRVRDCSGAFRAYRVAVLAAVPPAAIECQGYAYLEEILWRLQRNGVRFLELPIHFRDRTAGKTKINWREALSALVHLFRFGLRTWFGR